MAIELRGYQSDWIAGLRSGFATGSKSVLGVLPTGGGKTVCFSYLASRMVARSKRVAILAHREELLDQISGTLSEFDLRHGRISAGASYDKRLLAHVASVMTLVRRLDRVEVPDYAIVDEAHHATARSTWGKVIAHWRAVNPAFRLIGVTATPERLSGEGLGETFDQMVIGPTTGELIEMGALSPYRLISPAGHAADFDQVGKSAGDYNRKQVGEVMREKPAIVGDAVSLYRKTCDGVPAVAFCVSIEEAARTSERFRDAGYQSASIDGKMDRSDRRKLVADFKAGRIQVLTSCDLISEGFDLPGIVAAIMLRPTMSLALYLQQVGRSLRKAPGKASAIILDHVGNCGRTVGPAFMAKHGLPDDPREWSLEGSGKKKSSASDTTCRQCVKCYTVSPAYADKCRGCGIPFPIMARKIEEVEGELTEVDVDRIKFESRREQGQAETLEELREVARKRGYSPRWADHILAARQKKRMAAGR